jgi:hypothetical protein
MTLVDQDSQQKLAPVRSRNLWLFCGLVLQIVGMGGPVAYLVSKAHREGIGGHITAATVKLAWHGELDSKSGLALLIVGAVVFALGSTAMARPFVHRRIALFVAVPVAAIAGMFALGAIIVVVALLFALAQGGSDEVYSNTDYRQRRWRGRRRKRRAHLRQ